MHIDKSQNDIHIHDINVEGITGAYRMIISLIKKIGEIETDNIITEYDMSIHMVPKPKVIQEKPVKTTNAITLSGLLTMANDPKNKPYQEKLFTALDSKVEEGIMDYEELITFCNVIIDFLCKIYTEEVISNLLDFDIIKKIKRNEVLYLDMNDLFDILGYKYIIIEEKECWYKLRWN